MLQRLTREQHAARRGDEQPHGRALQRVRRARRQAVRAPRPRAERVLAPGGRRPRDRREDRDVQRGVDRRARPRGRDRHRSRLLGRRQPRRFGHDHRGHDRRVRALRRADLPAARAAHELAGQHPHGARFVRARVRGARLPTLDPGPAGRVRPRRPGRHDRLRARVVPPPPRPRRVAGLARGARHSRRRRAQRLDPPRHLAVGPTRARPWRSSGTSGAGKTTIGMLVPRLYDVVEGVIRVDGHDVRDLTLESLQAAVGLVPQDPHLFHDSIRANLRYAKPDATEAEMEAVLRGARSGTSSHRCPMGSKPSSASAGTGCRVARSNASRLPRLLLKDPCDRDPRRSNVSSRFRIGARDSRGVRRDPARPNRDRDRAPAVDDRRRRPDRRGRTTVRSSRPGPTRSCSTTAASIPICTARRRDGRPRTAGNQRDPGVNASFRPSRPINSHRPLPSIDSAMTDEESPDSASRRARLATRRHRLRIVGAAVATIVVVASVTTAFALHNSDAGPLPVAGKPHATKHSNSSTTLNLGLASKLDPPRPLSHDDPLKLWVGGDSLAGSFGPALGQMASATGVVDATIDYKVSSGLADNGVRDWYEHAQEAMASDESRRGRVHHRHQRRFHRQQLRLQQRRRPRLGSGLPREGRPHDGDVRRAAHAIAPSSGSGRRRSATPRSTRAPRHSGR